MAVPTSGLLESAPGGLPLVRDFGLNTAKAFNLSGFLGDTSGNLTFPGTVTYATGNKPNVISGSGATVTLTAAQSGSLILMDRAAGIVVTLPAPTVGLTYSFVATVSVTTNSYKVITDAGTTFLIGSVMSIDTDTSNSIAAWTGNGTTHISLLQAAAASNSTGGLIGTTVTFRCVTSTLWEVSGTTQAAGTVATPFSAT